MVCLIKKKSFKFIIKKIINFYNKIKKNEKNNLKK
jgi:hypothetical protein